MAALFGGKQEPEKPRTETLADIEALITANKKLLVALRARRQSWDNDKAIVRKIDEINALIDRWQSTKDRNDLAVIENLPKFGGLQ